MRSESLSNSPFRVLVVCGMPRSGTTLMGSLLATCNDVDVVTEPPSLTRFPALVALREQYLSWVDEVNSETFGKWRSIDPATVARRVGEFSAIFCRALKPVVDRGRYGEIEGGVLCLKQPNGELDRVLHEHLFSNTKPVYLYCLRSPREVYESILFAPWGRQTPINDFFTRLALSLRAIRTIQEVEPDRVHILNVGRLSECSTLRYKLLSHVLSQLGLNCGPETKAFIEHWPPVNRTVDAWGGPSGEALDHAERSLVEFDDLYADRVDIQQLLADIGDGMSVCDNSSSPAPLVVPSEARQVFVPRGNVVTRADMAATLYRHLHGFLDTPPQILGEPAFWDVPANHWAAPYIEQLQSEGYVTGIGDGRFCPEMPLSREQAAVVLLRGRSGPEYRPPARSSRLPFADVSPISWAAPWIAQAVVDGLIDGTDSMFYPQQSVTNEEWVYLMARSFGMI